MAYEPGPRGDSGDSDIRRCVGELETALGELAWALAREVIAAELDQRRRGPARAPARPAPEPEPELELAPVVAVAAAAAPTGKRPRWTREAVIAELCEWLISGIVEPAFLRRHGKPGLVTAATRIFGRFDSALNVANLYLAKQYPDGPPARRGAPATHGRAVAKRGATGLVPSHDEAMHDTAMHDTAMHDTTMHDTADPGPVSGPALDPVPRDATIGRDAPPAAPRSH